MFQLQPVGSVAHVQVCGTLSCMICGAEDLIGICKEKIAPKAHTLSADGKLSWEEVECLGSCANAPMAQIGKDYYEDLTAESFTQILDDLVAGKVPVPGPQNGRYGAEPKGGLTSLTEYEAGKPKYNASADLATSIGDTVKRIDGTEVPLRAPWLGEGEAAVIDRAKVAPAAKAVTTEKPKLFAKAPKDTDDLQQITGIGPKLEEALNEVGVYQYAQIAAWTPAQIAWIDENLASAKGRVERDDWVEQAKALTKKK